MKKIHEKLNVINMEKKKTKTKQIFERYIVIFVIISIWPTVNMRDY